MIRKLFVLSRHLCTKIYFILLFVWCHSIFVNHSSIAFHTCIFFSTHFSFAFIIISLIYVGCEVNQKEIFSRKLGQTWINVDENYAIKMWQQIDNYKH